VRSNSEWVIDPASFSDPAGVLDPATKAAFLAQSGGYNTGTGTTFSFQLINTSNLAVGGTITFTLVDPTRRVSNVPVTINGYNCGYGGIAVPLRIGQNDYLTHAYGDKCWMVENSKEGSPNATYYSFYTERLNNYYYDNVSSACPTGWSVPTVALANELVTIYKAAQTPASIKVWWNNSTVRQGWYDSALKAWNHWDVNEVWATQTYTTAIYWEKGSNQFLVNSAFSEVHKSVRCVRD
jgi:hypothetical protein